MTIVVLYSEQHAVHVAKMQAMNERQGTNTDFNISHALTDQFGKVISPSRIYETPVRAATAYYTDVESGNQVEATTVVDTDSETADQEISKYLGKWPDSKVVSKNATNSTFGRTWQQILESNGLDMEDAVIDTMLDPDAKACHKLSTKSHRATRDLTSNDGPA